MVSLLAVMLALLGLLLPFWGFVAIGIAVAMTRGNWGLALVLAAVADIIFGHPVGLLHFMVIPFTLVTVVALFGRHFLTKHMRDEVRTSL